MPPADSKSTSTSQRKGRKASQRPEAPANGVVHWRCKTCGHDWRGHSQIKVCGKPGCGSRDLEILEVMTATESGRRHLSGNKSSSAMPPPGKVDVILGHATDADCPVNWGCDNGHTWWTNGVTTQCPLPSCASQKVALLPGCEISEPRWKKLGEKKRSQPASAPIASETVSPDETSTSTPAGIARNDSGASRFPSAERHARPSEGGTPAESIQEIAIGLIDRHPDNPRKNFGQAGLDELAEDIKRRGIDQPVNVQRAAGGRYLILAGERRYLAAKVARLKTLLCRVRDVTDEEAYEIMIQENLKRVDLDDLEKARAYQLGIEKCGLTQEAFAKRFGRSQEHVSNTIRLLALPPAWQEHLIQRRITATHARELLPYLDVPAVLERMNDWDPAALAEMPAAEFKENVDEAVAQASQPMTFQEYDGGGGCKFKPTKPQEAELDIRTVRRTFGPGKERRAFNVALWKELNAAAKKRRKEKQPKTQQRTMREKFASQHDQSQIEQAERDFGHHMLLERCNYLGGQISEALILVTDGEIYQRAVLTLLASDQISALAKELAIELSGKKNFPRGLDGSQALGAVIGLRQEALQPVLCRALMHALAKPREFRPSFGLPLLEWMAQRLKIKPLEGWTPTAEFVEKFLASRLAGLLAQFPAEAVEACGEKPTAQSLLKNWPTGLVPAELERVTAKGVVSKGPGKKKAKAKR
jgi:ParB family chromosome partitioning protein